MQPEEKARQDIDNLLELAGWKVQGLQELNLSASSGVAVREFPLRNGTADYLLFVDKKQSGLSKPSHKEPPSAELLSSHRHTLQAYPKIFQWFRNRFHSPMKALALKHFSEIQGTHIRVQGGCLHSTDSPNSTALSKKSSGGFFCGCPQQLPLLPSALWPKGQVKMKYNPDIHHRRSIRLKNYDYSQEGMYFITICTLHQEHLLGNISDGKMILNENGNIANDFWLQIPENFPNVQLDEYIIMPNHIHGIITVGAIHVYTTP